MTKTKEISIISLILITLLFIFFWKAATLQELFITPDHYSNDIVDLNYPYKNFLSECLKQKKSFLWTPDIYCGYPIHAEGQGGFYYPLNLLLFWILPAYAAFNYSVILAFFLTGIFTYLYARLLSLSKTASLFSAITFMFSGFFVLHVRHLNMIQTACWLPLLLFLIEKFFKTDKAIYIILTGIIFAFQVLAGFPQIAYYSFLAMLSYFLFGIFRKKKIFSILVSIFVIGIIGAGLSATQWIPTYELTKLSIRSKGAEYIFATALSYRFKDLIMFIFPSHFGNVIDNTYLLTSKGVLFWENCFYMGLIPLILAVIVIVFRLTKDRYVKFFFSLIIIFLIISLAEALSLSNIFRNVIPGFKYFRIHQRFLFLAVFSLCILSGFGFEFLRKIPLKLQNILIILVPLAIFDLFRFGIKQNPTFNSKKWLSNPKSVNILQNLEKNNLYRIGSTNYYLHKYCFELAKGYTYTEPYFLFREFLPPHFNMNYHISSIGGRSGLIMKRISDFDFFYHSKTLVLTDSNTIIYQPSALKLMGLQSCKYIINGYAIAEKYEVDGIIYHEKEIKLIANVLPETAAVYIWKAPECMPRTYIVPRAKLVFEEKNILPTMVSKSFDPEKTVILEKKINHGSSSTENSRAIITKYENTEVEIEAGLTADGFLVLTDTYYPGWKVFVDNKKQDILRANYLFRAVQLKKGKHTVKFIFKPISFQIGRYISIITFLLVIVLLGYCIRANSSKCEPGTVV